MRPRYRRNQLRNQLRMVDQFSRILERRIAVEMNRFVQEAAQKYPAKPNYRRHEKNLSRILRSVLREAGLVASERVRSDVRKAVPWLTEKKLDTEESLRQRIVGLSEQSAARRVTGMADTSRTRINNAISRGLEANEDPGQIATRIRAVSEMSRSRARTIARTESHQMIMSSQFASMEETSDEMDIKMKKVWVASDDDRTRDTHLEADGQKVALDESFSVGNAELMHPGDPEGPPEEVINCRCGIVWEI